MRSPIERGETRIQVGGETFVLQPADIGVIYHGVSGGSTSLAEASLRAIDAWLVVSASGVVLGVLEEGVGDEWGVRRAAEPPKPYSGPVRLGAEVRTADTWQAAIGASWWAPTAAR